MRSSLMMLLFLALLPLGCSSSKTKTYPVSGTVTWDNSMLPEGHILFEPAEGGEGDAGQIKEGKFSFRAKAGKKKVQIRASREADKVDPVMGAKPRVQFIPEEYNAKTTLEVEVKPEGENTFEFPLKSKP